MNEQLTNFINGIGMLTEIWSITFNNFKKRGMNDEEAIKHTGAFMTSFTATMLNYGKEETSND